jgi:uncharacterized membrane protein
MKAYSQRIATIAILMIVSLAILVTLVAAESAFQVESTNIKVYRDGLVHITQELTVDELLTKIDLQLLSWSVENLIVLDENKIAVDYSINGENLTLFTLGEPSILIEYDTIALTNKEANVWTLILNSPYNLTVLLPYNSTIIYLNQMPTEIDVKDNELSLSLYPSQWELSYIVPLIPTDQNGTPWDSMPLEHRIAIVAMVIAITITTIIVVFIIMQRRKINSNRILNRHPELMKEDKAVIEFLAENEGKAFEAEIRVRFPDIPRTSLWRLIRRLEKLEIVEVKKIGLENQVQIKK